MLFEVPMSTFFLLCIAFLFQGLCIIFLLLRIHSVDHRASLIEKALFSLATELDVRLGDRYD